MLRAVLQHQQAQQAKVLASSAVSKHLLLTTGLARVASRGSGLRRGVDDRRAGGGGIPDIRRQGKRLSGARDALEHKTRGCAGQLVALELLQHPASLGRALASTRIRCV